ncbi:sugar phosphate isomerase/epimerase family protein [Deferrisoma sp.]
MVALSTAYFTLRSPEPAGADMADGLRRLGFGAVEIDYRVTAEQMRALRPVLAAAGIAVASVHAPFPRDPWADPRRAHLEGPKLTSPDPDERRAAVRLVAESLAWAEDLGAPVVVVHVGAVEWPGEPDPLDLERRFREAGRDGPGYEDLRRAVAEARERWAPRFRDAALSSLDRLAAEALRRGVALGLENRYHPAEIPSADELALFFRELDGAPLGYWHDTGHAAAQTCLGFQEGPEELLERFADRVAGFHLHDAVGLDDHRAPGEGELDFAPLAPHFRADRPRVLEIHPRSPEPAVLAARERFEACPPGLGTTPAP